MSEAIDKKAVIPPNEQAPVLPRDNDDAPSTLDLDYAISDVSGAAHAAAVMLYFIAETGDDGAVGTDEALVWLSRRLSDAVENLDAIHGSREPRWRTLGDADSIRPALARAKARGERREALRAEGDEA